MFLRLTGTKSSSENINLKRTLSNLGSSSTICIVYTLIYILHMNNQGNVPSLSDGEWKLNLPSQGQKFLQQLEDQVEKLKKERDQKQFQIDSLEQVQVSYIWTDHPVFFLNHLSFLMVEILRKINHWENL